MNEHAGPASALSVLIVGVFAILLHDRQPPPSSLPTAPPKKVSQQPLTEAMARPSPAPTAPVVPVPTVAPTSPHQLASSPPPVPKAPVPRVETPVRPIETVEATNPPTSSTPTAGVKEAASGAQPRSPVRPKSPFTLVLAGEKLADVAHRVYGTAEAAEALWRANRDQVALIDSPLSRGTMLRTP